MIFETWRNNLALHIYISFLKTTDIRPQFKDGRRNEKYGDESTLSERVFDVSKGSNLNPKEATSPRSVSTRTRHDTRAIFFSCAPIRREIESVFRSFANILLFDWTWTRKLMRLWKWAQKSKTFRWQFSEFTTETTEKFNKKNHFDETELVFHSSANILLLDNDSVWARKLIYAWKWLRNRKRSITVFRISKLKRDDEKFNKENHLEDLQGSLNLWKS